jgi:hypothetical protein
MALRVSLHFISDMSTSTKSVIINGSCMYSCTLDPCVFDEGASQPPVHEPIMRLYEALVASGHNPVVSPLSKRPRLRLDTSSDYCESDSSSSSTAHEDIFPAKKLKKAAPATSGQSTSSLGDILRRTAMKAVLSHSPH